MIKQLTFYTVVCDSCGADSNDGTEYAAWNDKSYAEDVADDADFVEIDDKHYCPNCYTYDADGEVVVLGVVKGRVYQH